MINAYYHAQNNPTERVNRVLKTALSSYIDDHQSNWSQNLQHLACAFRTAKHETTKCTPYFANFGREMIVNGREFQEIRKKPGSEHKINLDWKSEGLRNLHKNISKNIAKAAHTSKVTYDLRRRPVSYMVGDYVWKKNFPLSNASKHFSAKLDKKFTGPHRIKKKLGSCVYELEDRNGRSVGEYHVKDLKPDTTEMKPG